MANQKISDSTASTSLDPGDLIPIVPVAGGSNQHMTVANFLRTYTRTAAEEAAGIQTVINGDYEEGHPFRYGAKADGTTDDGAAVSDWLDVGLQGVQLKAPEGTMLCTTWTQKVIDSDLSIESNGAVIKGTASHEFIRPAGGSVRIKGVIFDTWLSVVENDNGDSGTTPLLEVEGCEFKTISGDTISHIRPFNTAIIRGNKFESCANVVVRLGTNTYADQDNWQRMVVSDNVCDGVSTTGVGNTSFCLLYGKSATVSNNVIQDISSDTNEAWAIYTKCRYASITGNSIEGLTATTPSNVRAINVKGATRVETSAPQGYNVTVSGNTIKGSTEGAGINISNNSVSVTGNVVEDFINGIVCGIEDDNLVTGNTVYCPNTTAGTYGINVAGEGNNQIVTNNHIYSGQYGIRTVCSTSTASNWIINGNSIDTPGTGGIYAVHSARLTNASYCNNHFQGGPRAIDIDNCTKVAIKGNNWDGLTAGNVSQWIKLNNSSGIHNLEMSDNGSYTMQTTDAVTTSIFLFAMPDESACIVEARAVGMESDGSDRAIYGKGACFYRDGGGNATQEGSTYDQFTDIESDATWGGLIVDASGTQARVRVDGATSQNVNWAVDINVRSVS